ncbi:metal dependent phosphohydrolase [Marinobacter nitratireducens]|uniref:Metal dependent phosphohydrolase n=1 Tax=Marinobacter nitratireducens TaxID=1137280 RepID=A0A072NIT5_9GAMM|nr:HD-GYP domain-containing protein [Marinobacter nitratireducens]KEF33065.1 metal dependent phosphohydrolase [Marinobacter nitratireducens]
MWFRRKIGGLSKPSQVEGTSRNTLTRQRARLPVDLLQLGMQVIELDRPWTEVPVLFQGFTLEDASQAAILRRYCEWVLVEDDERNLTPIIERITVLKRRTTEPLEESQSLIEELPRAQRAWSRTQNFVEQVTRDIEAGNEFSLKDARPVIRDCVDSVKANSSAMFWMGRIKSRDAYTAEHCLRVAILTIAFARFLGVPEEDLETAGMCGLLHDLGKLKVPDHILNKPAPLTPEELQIMRKHTNLGYEMLRSDPNLDPIIVDVARHHHERIDGKGYPRQLADWQISRFARMISIIDAFDAITSDRCYRNGRPAAEAIKILYKNRGQQFDPAMVEAFIRLIGIYPAGSLVELTSGEVAIVVAAHPGRKLKPRIEIVLDAQKQPTPSRVVDLSAESSTLEIATALPDDAYGVSLRERIRELIASASKNAS